jgi:hypothetical protein
VLVIVSNKIIRCKQRKVVLMLKSHYYIYLVAKNPPSPQVQHLSKNVDAFPEFLNVKRFSISGEVCNFLFSLQILRRFASLNK